MTGDTFCTMGGMNHEMPMHHRKLEVQHHHGSHDHRNWDAMPVILPDDKTNEDDHNGQRHHDMHGMDDSDEMHTNGHHHGSMNHETNDNKMNHDHSSHNSMHGMSQGTAMYMDGFHSALFPPSQGPPPPCLNLFHPSWTLHTPGKFVFAMIFVTFMGMLVEACGVWRVKCLRKGKKFRREIRLERLRAQWEEQQQNGQSNSMQGQQLEFRRRSQPRGMQYASSDISDVSSEGNMETSSPPALSNSTSANLMCPPIIRKAWRTIVPTFIRRKCTCTGIMRCCSVLQRTNNGGNVKDARRYDVGAALLHASRAWFGYLLMLSVMTYAVEFLVSAVIGMVLGRYWFVDTEGGSANITGGGGGGVMNGAAGVGGGIGGMGSGDGGVGGTQQSDQIDFGMTHLHTGNDGTWGGGGDPCCGIDDEDEDSNDEEHLHHDLREPLLSALVGSDNVGVTRRSAGGTQIEENL